MAKSEYPKNNNPMTTVQKVSGEITSNDCKRLLVLAGLHIGEGVKWTRSKKRKKDGRIWRDFEYYNRKALVFEENGSIGVLMMEDEEGKDLIIREEPVPAYECEELSSPGEKGASFAKRIAHALGLKTPINHDIIKGGDYRIHIWWGRSDGLSRNQGPQGYANMVIFEYAEKSVLKSYRSQPRMRQPWINLVPKGVILPGLNLPAGASIN